MSVQIYYSEYASPVGRLRMASTEEGLCRITFSTEKVFSSWMEKHFGDYDLIKNHETHKTLHQQLSDYFGGQIEKFTIPLDMHGTDFQKSVWEALLEIPYGETATYGDIARQVGYINQSRAVGTANGANPIPIVVPCHRVIGADGKLIGYSGGLHIKKYLLRLEGAILI